MRSIHVTRVPGQTLGVSVLVETEKLNKDYADGRGHGTWVVKAVVPVVLVRASVTIVEVIEVDVLVELES